MLINVELHTLTIQPILVSGGAGYIGSHTALALMQAGYLPVVIDNLSTSDGAAAGKFGPFRRGDIGDRDFVAAVCAEFKPAALIHFAAFSLVAESVTQPDKYFENNVTKAGLLFDTVRDHGVKHVVFSSTAAVYGAVAGDRPVTEAQPLQPINPYGASKLQAESYLRQVAGLTSVALRYFNAAGAAASGHGIGEAHWPESHLIPNVVLAAMPVNRPLAVFGSDYPTPDGTAIRDYIHVEDLAQAHLLALDYLFKGGASVACNLGTGAGSSVLDIIKAVERAMGAPVARAMHPPRLGDPAILVADTAQAQSLLGWRARQDLTAIVSSAVAWHRSEAYQAFLQARLAGKLLSTS